MKELPDLKQLSNAEKDTLIVGLWEELVKLREQVQGLQPGQKKPKKTSRNSSLPPAKGFKADVETSEQPNQPELKRVAHRLGGRKLTAQPDQIVVARATACSQCGVSVSEEDQQLQQVYE